MSSDTATLLLRLVGPMQAWGSQSRFDHRDTGKEPTKSGVIGLAAAALGKPRDDRPGPWPTLAQLAGLRLGVRVLKEGAVGIDYQTAGGGKFAGRKKYGVWTASGTVGGTVVSHRHYLADADFLVGLEGNDRDLLAAIEEALRAPHWPLSLGRKSYVPSLPVALPLAPPQGSGLRAMPLKEALLSFDIGSHRAPDKRQRLVLEAPRETAVEIRRDVPLSFLDRTFSVRGVQTDWLEL